MGIKMLSKHHCYLTLLYLVFACCTILAAFPSYTVLAVKPTEIRIGITIPEQHCSEKTTNLLSFSLQPGKEVAVSLTAADGKGIPFSLLSKGWSGTHYQQWLSYSPGDIHCSDTAPQATLVLSSEENTYNGIVKTAIEIKNGSIYLPFPRSLAKRASLLPELPYTNGLRIEVKQNGIYKVTATDLQQCGMNINKIDPRTYRLFEQGREIPLFRSNAYRTKMQHDDVILFYGKQLRSPTNGLEEYSFTNNYWLTWGTNIGSRVTETSGARTKDPTNYVASATMQAQPFYDTVMLEEDNRILWLGNLQDTPPDELTAAAPSDETIDNWYWGPVGQTELTTFKFELLAPQPQNFARISVGLMGLSSIDSLPNDHALELFINDNPASAKNKATWDGQRFYTFVSDTFSTRFLLHGTNALTLRTFDRSFADRTALNWIKIEYLRGYEALNDQCVFTNAPHAVGTSVAYSITGFSSPNLELWDIANQRIFSGFISTNGTGSNRNKKTLLFQDSTPLPAQYLVQTTDKRIKPHFMVLDTIRTRWDTLSQVDYLCISTDSFRVELDTLLATHRQHGLKTAFISIRDIYNRFSYGLCNPESIRSLLKYLFSIASDNPPQFLLLGGDTTYDLDKTNAARNIVPTHLSRIPKWGPGSDDDYFSTVNGNDNFPDLAVGRFPAQNRNEMRQIVTKTVRAINTPTRGYWRDNILMLGGGESAFTKFNDDAATTSIGNTMNILRMDADPESRFYKDEFVAPKLIADHINAGVNIVNFNGHGGGFVWSDNNFFGYNNLPLLHNGQWGTAGRLPSVFSFTCLTGFFESSEYRSLGEEFLRSSSNGAISFYGASGYTSRDGNILINHILLEAALQGEFTTIGELLTYCETSMLARYDIEHLSLVRQYNLLGDPALPWHLPPSAITIHQQMHDSDRVLTVSGKTQPINKGQVKISILSDNTTWNQAILPLQAGSFSHAFSLKEMQPTANVCLRAVAWNDSTEIRGWAALLTDTLAVQDVATQPSRPTFDSAFSISCSLVVPPSSPALALMCLYALTSSVTEKTVFSSMLMHQTSSGKWVSGNTTTLSFSGNGNDRLYIYFRLIGSDFTRQSPLTSLLVAGQPDLAFAQSTLPILFVNDSLRVLFKVINTGNAPAQPFAVALAWSNQNVITDTLKTVYTSTVLNPGSFLSFTITLPDTAGALNYAVLINPHNSVSETRYDNNRLTGTAHVALRDCRSPTDTLWIRRDTIGIQPTTRFKKNYRLFVIADTLSAATPLQTPSSWIMYAQGTAQQWHLHSRPALSGTDSISWFYTPPTTVQKQENTVSGSLTLMRFDTTLLCWRFSSEATSSPTKSSVTFTSSGTASFALSTLHDNLPPEITVSVSGKTLTTIDYAAKNRPFSINIADASGVAPQSIKLRKNGILLTTANYSSADLTADLRTINLTTYPQPEHTIDSLTIYAEDLAGNQNSRTVAYLSGTDLAIKYLSCHPNPFTARKRDDGSMEQIRFAFLLTDIAQQVTLALYTVSSKKIKTWYLNERIGYQQVLWDGRDQDGFRIANGTYYVKLTAKNDRKSVNKTIRIAKLEGY